MLTAMEQVYLSLYLQLLPLPTLIQEEIIPVVRPCYPFHLLAPLKFIHKLNATNARNPIASFLGPRIVWCIPTLQARLRRIHFQRCSRGSC